MGQPAPLAGRGADLGRPGLRRADLRGPDLERADLERADLERADLERADLRRAAQWQWPAQRRGRPAGGARLLAPAGPLRRRRGAAARRRHPDPGRPRVSAGPAGLGREPVRQAAPGQRGRGGRRVLGRAAG
ncbi:pentapeptide repeat-containing protein [Micromonospora sp. GCM10011542]|uniref:pentapeptide repeat-containing protein n=1 Tax=Micromonospora sp. GCM10011542 TaxID=3317337 RepID=UPI0036085E94